MVKRVAVAVAVGTTILALPAQAARPATCTLRSLHVSIDPRPGNTAGSTYYSLRFTNIAKTACTLRGYPGVFAVASNGRMLGSPASHNPAHAVRTVTISAAATARSILQITDAHNFPPTRCVAIPAAGLRIYPPGATQATTVRFSFLTCSRRGSVVLHTAVVQSVR